MENQKPSFNRRKFLTNAAKIAGVGAAGFIYIKGCNNEPSEVEPGPGNGHAFITQPYIHTIEEDKVYIRWITNLKSYSWVEFGEDEKLANRVHAVTDGMVNAFSRIHEVVLENLKPGTVYTYRVVSKEIIEYKPYSLKYGKTIYSNALQFKTFDANAAEVNWLVLNDLHDWSASFAHLICLHQNKPYDYVFLNGDMYNNPEDEGQVIEYVIKPCADVFASKKPMIFVRGNHEVRGKYAREMVSYFSFPKGMYFTYKTGPVFVIVLDTGEDKEDASPVYAGLADFESFRKKQALWLEKVLQSEACKAAPFRVVMMHIPTYYTVGAKGELHSRELFSPLFDQYKIDVVISGHTHKYGVYPPNETHQYAIIIGGGPVVGTRTLIHVSSTIQQLTVNMLDDSGKQVGEYIVKR